MFGLSDIWLEIRVIIKILSQFLKFSQKDIEIGDFEKLFFELAILDIFFQKRKNLHPRDNQSKVLGYQGSQ